jgi:hypothetical protein
MRQVIVRYRLKPDQVERNEALVRAVYDELAQAQPDGLHYATFKLEDGVSFVHVASHDGPNPLPGVEAFRVFTAGIAERCEEPPVSSEMTAVGSYRFDPANS